MLSKHFFLKHFCFKVMSFQNSYWLLLCILENLVYFSVSEKHNWTLSENCGKALFCPERLKLWVIWGWDAFNAIASAYVHDSERFTFMISTMTDKAGTITVPILHVGRQTVELFQSHRAGVWTQVVQSHDQEQYFMSPLWDNLVTVEKGIFEDESYFIMSFLHWEMYFSIQLYRERKKAKKNALESIIIFSWYTCSFVTFPWCFPSHYRETVVQA